MYKILMFALLVVVPAVWLRAQDKPQPDSGQSSSKSSGYITLEGCLETDQGHYLLLDNNGMSHQLSGAAGKLKHFVKHQIEVSGEPGIETLDTTQSGIAATAAEIKVFRVKTVRELAKTCSAN